MKLSLIFGSQRLQDALRYYPLSDSSQILQMEDLTDSPPDGMSLGICPDFATAEALWGDLPRLHVCVSFGILVLSSRYPPDLDEFLRTHILFTLRSDPAAAKLTAGYKSHDIEHLVDFYANPLPHKVLLTSRRDLAEAIISSNPEGFMHLLPAEDGLKLCLGAELWQYDESAFRAALSLAERLSQQVKDLRLTPFMTAQICLKEGAGAYGFFADRYDGYMAHVDYEIWYLRLTEWYHSYVGGSPQKVLELACGTANVAVRFVQSGARVDACDISVQMLENAAQKQLRPNLYQASLTDPIPGRDYELIICLFDSINYLLQVSQIKDCLAEVYEALVPGGLFVFDISTLLNSMENFSDVCNYQQEEKSHMYHEAFYVPGKRLQISRLHLFKPRAAGYAMLREEHLQKVYLAQEMIDIISQSPFKLTAIHTTDSRANFYPKKLGGIDHRHYRLFFVLQKR